VSARPRTVGLLHPGQMGAAVGAQLRRAGHTVLWCPDGRGDATQRRALRADLQASADLRGLLERSDVVVSICPPAAAEEVAGRVAGTGYRGLYVDANAVNPATARRIAAPLSAAGATVVDGSIIGAPPTAERAVRLYLAGPASGVATVAELFAGGQVEAVPLGEELGGASALKMAFASFQKASRVLAALAHALADEHGVTDALLAEAQRMPALILGDRDFLPKVAGRAWRWSPELREVARTLDDAGLPPDLADATAAVLQRWAEDRDRTDLPVAAVLDHLRR
jgi:3-hydroxyisobutyrate dehydrogenase-like beta-hydroxyacid dehydrogenase